MPDLKTLSDAELNALFDETERQIDALIDSYAPDYNIPDEVNNRIDEMEALTNRIITERDHRYRSKSGHAQNQSDRVGTKIPRQPQTGQWPGANSQNHAQAV